MILKFYLLTDFWRGRERERDWETWFGVPLIYVFIGWFLYVPWPGTKPATLAYRDSALTNWATQPGPKILYF